jgi:hypothetical protein
VSALGDKQRAVTAAVTAAADKRAVAVTAEKPSRFAAAIAGVRVHEPVTVMGVPGAMRLVGHGAVQEIEGAVYKRMAELGLALSELTATTYESERAVRTLAESVRDPADHSKPLGTLEEWQQVDLDTIVPLWMDYNDLRERQNPIEVPPSERDVATIQLALQKKSGVLLRSCGLRVLSNWLLSTADLPATSPEPSSTSSPSSPET